MASSKWLAAVLLSIVCSVCGDDIAQSASCVIDEIRVVCVGAHYPVGISPPGKLENGLITVTHGHGCTDARNPSEAAEILLVHRGGCSFADKAQFAWNSGYAAMIIGNR